MSISATANYKFRREACCPKDAFKKTKKVREEVRYLGTYPKRLGFFNL